MDVQENSGGFGSEHVVPDVRQTLVEVTSQLAADSPAAEQQAIAQPPQVVFVGKQDQAETQSPASGQHIEVTVQRRAAADMGSTGTSAIPNEPSSHPSVAQPQASQSELQEQLQQTQSRGAIYARPLVTQQDEASEDVAVQSPAFLVDPFDQAIDGSVPVLTSLPIAKAIEMTEQVVSRENAGEHYAWRLQRPYPDLGNSPEVESASVQAESVPEPEAKPVASYPESNSERQISPIEDRRDAETVSWTNTEVVAEGDTVENGDNFYARPGDIISIDGNQGYDHIDLRSYSIDDAQFQPGSILLSPTTSENDNALELGKPDLPIIIRHRGVGFAIFKGEVRVEL